MTDARLAQLTVETATYGTDSDARLAQLGVEAATYGTDSDARLAQIGAEVTLHAIIGDARLSQLTVEVATFGNPSIVGPGGRLDGAPSGVINHVGACPQPGLPISSSFSGYVPKPGYFVTPVQIGTVNNLTAARTPAGRVILAWNDGNDFLLSVLEDSQDIYRDNVVGPDDYRTVFSIPPTGQILHGSVWVDGLDLFCAIAYIDINGGGYSKCYIADNAENPVTWTLRGQIDGQGPNGGGIIDISSCGPATITRTGRWVIPFNAWFAYGGSAPSDGSGLFTSVDRGLTWTVLVEHRQPPSLSGTSGPIANTIAQDPVTGNLYWSYYWGPLSNEGRILSSTDGGATWTTVDNDTPTQYNFYTDNGTKFYAASEGPGYYRAWEVVTPADPSTWVDTGINIINSNQTPQFQFIVLGCNFAVIETNHVAVARGGWIVGRVQYGAHRW